MLNKILILLGWRTEAPVQVPADRIKRALITDADQYAYRWCRGLERPKH